MQVKRLLYNFSGNVFTEVILVFESVFPNNQKMFFEVSGMPKYNLWFEYTQREPKHSVAL